MKILVTGSSGHLGEALVRTLRNSEHDVVGTDCIGGGFTDRVGTIADPGFATEIMAGVDSVLHTATLHKPHVATHTKQDFVDTNITGTLNLLEAAVPAGVRSFIFTSTTSTFGDALTPADGSPAAWITEDVVPVPKNIYGVTKVAAEDICRLFHRNLDLPCIVLRTSRFFPEEDDRKAARDAFEDQNLKANEFLYRRVDIEDVVSAHLCAIERASDIRFAKYIISATTPFRPHDTGRLRSQAEAVVQERAPGYQDEYRRRGWMMFTGIDRVYVNEKARRELGWTPRHNFSDVLDRLRGNGYVLSDLARTIGRKGYHAETFEDGPFPVE